MPYLRLIALIVFSQSVYFIAWYGRSALRAARKAGIADPTLRAGALFVPVFLAVWLAAAVVLGDHNNFPLGDESQRPWLSAVSLLFLAPALLWAFLSRAGKTLHAAYEPDQFIRVQWYRMLGAMFLFPLLAYGSLPAEFSLPAGIGDLLTGFFAPFVARAIEERRPGAYSGAVLWNLFGILDLVVATATAIHSKSQILAMYPVSLIPLFLGPPMGIMTHVLSLRSLALHRGEIEVESRRSSPADRSSPSLVR